MAQLVSTDAAATRAGQRGRSPENEHGIGIALAIECQDPGDLKGPVRGVVDPGPRVVPPSSVPMVITGARPAASLYAVTKSFFAVCVTASSAWFTPFRTTLPSPVMAGVGWVPMSPVMVVEFTAPATVIPEPARIA